MSENTVAIIGLLLFIVGLPLALSAHEHFQAKKLARPVVRFAYDGWRVPSLLWTLFQTTFGLSLVIGAGATLVTLQAPLLAFLLATLILRVAWWQFPAVRLFLTYWWHDGRAVLVFDKAQRMAFYDNRVFHLKFALADVVQLTFYHSLQNRAASDDYSYTVLTFMDSTELVVSSLLCDYASLGTLVRGVKTTAMQQKYAWLPTDFYSRRLFGSFL
ncbi:hypothetical protein GKZ68_16800 [Hymenobacter sp. BRD128]|uniref:hypothetical protein n=1 Tax=Hymenobacter sp. BRD128 TaxID=2675878 RepID=UPI001563D2A1|nr:hypothetical protein [Hymenobacter sp. BRD128]QKG58138.1 hypothetical protein GKZ68_16800 [Hymenobacter sp. BRD128]